MSQPYIYMIITTNVLKGFKTLEDAESYCNQNNINKNNIYKHSVGVWCEIK